ncbi:MAG: methyltransferase domain-containing protein [Fulvivirga sp.]
MRSQNQITFYNAFMNGVSKRKIKVQIGARDKKRGPDWIAIDLYDDSDIIDENWDLHCLPIQDNVVDCYVCNAVLEHVTDPALAIFEMFRTLKPGGEIWAEVPFMQYYHPTPGDYSRWTVEGFELMLRDFSIISSGVSTMISHEIPKLYNYLSSKTDINISKKSIEEFIGRVKKYQIKNDSSRLYSSLYVWGRKLSNVAQQKSNYFNWLRSQYEKKNDLPYSSDLKLTRTELENIL